MKNYLILFVFSILVFSCSKEVILPQYGLSVSSNPTNGGTVNPSSGTYEEGKLVSITATPASEYLFLNWSGSVTSTKNPLGLTIDTDKSLTANFEKRTYPLNLTIEGNGVVNEEIVNVANNSVYPSGTNVKLTARPNEGWEFTEWKGDYVGTDTSFVIAINNAKSITAVFNEKVIINENILKVKSLRREYWENIPLPRDLFLSIFQNSPRETQTEIQTVGSSWGDFNLDGYLDIFNAGGSYDGTVRSNSAFLLYNRSKNVFEEVNLFNDKNIKILGGNTHTIIPKYLNNDDYLDLIVIDSGDEGREYQGPNEPVRIVLSDGKGGYDLKEIETNENDDFFIETHSRKWGGDIGDLNNDGIDDLFLACNSINYIYWGVNEFPYFTKKNRIFFVSDYNNQIFNNKEGKSICSECADHTFDAKIIDIDKDGKNDVVLFGGDKKDYFQNRILLNKTNNGNFSNENIIRLPLNDSIKRNDIQDIIVDDFNEDGYLDIFYLLNKMDGTYITKIYIQESPMLFKIKENFSNYSDNYGPTKLIYCDLNNDNIKDIFFLDSYGDKKENLNSNRIYNKKALINKGNFFETFDLYLLNNFLKDIRDKYFK